MIAAAFRHPVVAAELQRVAAHEASHAVIAETLSAVPAVVKIWQEVTGGVLRGQCSHPWALTGDDTWRRMFGLSGACGETLLAGLCQPGRNPGLGDMVRARMSVSDAVLAGDYDLHDVDACMARVHANYYAIADRAHREIALFHQLNQ